MSELDENKVNARLADIEAHKVEKLLADLKAVATTPAGRRVLWHLMERSGTFRLSFVPGKQDVTDFNEGRKDMGNYLLNQVMNVDVKIFAQMQREHRLDAQREQVLIKKARQEE